VIERPVDSGAALHRARTRSCIEREVDDIATWVSDIKDLVLPHQVASRWAPLSILPSISGDHNSSFWVGESIRNAATAQLEPQRGFRNMVMSLFLFVAEVEGQAIFCQWRYQDDEDHENRS
jgi:hypothetical protein